MSLYSIHSPLHASAVSQRVSRQRESEEIAFSDGNCIIQKRVLLPRENPVSFQSDLIIPKSEPTSGNRSLRRRVISLKLEDV